LKQLKEQGVITGLLDDIQLKQPRQPVPEVEKGPSDRFVSIAFTSGRAFIDTKPGSDIELTVCFKSQRSKTMTFKADVEPKINKVFMFDISSCPSISAISDPLQIYLVEKSNPTNLLSATSIDIRTLLISKTKLLELKGVNTNSNSTVGLLEFSFSVYDKQASDEHLPEVLLTEIEVERRRTMDKNRLFNSYTKRWLEEFHQIHESFKTRSIQPLSLTENNDLVSVCNFLPKTDCTRVISSPRQLSRFVSTFEESKITNYLTTPMASVLSKSVNQQTRSCLLAGFLITSFTIDAYVVHGTKVLDGNLSTHYWVVTRDQKKNTTFIEPTTAKRYSISTNTPYKQIFAVYNQSEFLANVQKTDLINRMSFDFESEKDWKKMDSIPDLNYNLELKPSNFEIITEYEQNLESTLQKLFASYRANHLNVKHTNYDQSLQKVLAISLSDYEFEKSFCVSPGVETTEFVDAVKRLTPTSQTFKAKPKQYQNMTSASEIFSDVVKSVRSDQDLKKIFNVKSVARHAVRVKVFSYAENVCAIWVIFACIY